MPYPTVAEIRLLEPDVDGVSRFPSTVLAQRLAEAISDIETICERSFVPVDVTEVSVVGFDRDVRLLRASNQHREGAANGVTECVVRASFRSDETLAPVDLAIQNSYLLRRTGGWLPGQEVTVTYGSGLAECPPKIASIVARLTRVYAVPDRAERFSVAGDGRTFFLSQPGTRKLGMPDLDATIAKWSLHHGLAI
jgi:hypothetical protein